MDRATYELDILASCHQLLLSQLYFFPLSMRVRKGRREGRAVLQGAELTKNAGSTIGLSSC